MDDLREAVASFMRRLSRMTPAEWRAFVSGLDAIRAIGTRDEWNESEHSRNKEGKFTNVDGGVAGEKTESIFDPEADREKIRNGTYSKHINPGRQNRHIEGTAEYEKHEEKLIKRGAKPSILYGDAQSLIDSHAGSGKIWRRNSKDTMPVEDVALNEIIGKVWDGKRGEWAESSHLRIVYSKGGAHAFPIMEDE
jgi:hypothetical protein